MLKIFTCSEEKGRRGGYNMTMCQLGLSGGKDLATFRPESNFVLNYDLTQKLLDLKVT